MSSDKPKPRKSNPSVRFEPAWRVKRTDNVAGRRYFRGELLSLYAPSSPPILLGEQDHAAEVVLADSLPPVFRPDQGFEHSLGEDINARERPPAKVPDWFSEPNPEKKPVPHPPEGSYEAEKRPVVELKPIDPPQPKPVEAPSKPMKVVIDKKAVIRNLPKDLESFNIRLEVKEMTQPLQSYGDDFFREEYSLIDREMEKRLKHNEDDEETMPEWAAEKPAASSVPLPVTAVPVQVSVPAQSVASAAPQSLPSPIPEFDSRAPKFHIDLLQEQIKANDPFAKLIFHKGVPDSKGFMCCIPLSLPLEKAWFYKDPQGQVQGPFSSIDMYNWNLVGYFSQSLLVAWRSTSAFLPLAELQRASSDFWGRESELAHVLKPAVQIAQRKEEVKQTEGLPVFSPPKSAKHTLEIDPNQAIKSLLGLEQKPGYTQKPEGSLANRRR